MIMKIIIIIIIIIIVIIILIITIIILIIIIMIIIIIIIIITISCKNSVFDSLCFINLTKWEEMIVDNLFNFKSRYA